MAETQKINILLVDDNEDYFILTRYLLSEIDPALYFLEWAREYEDALSMIRKNRFDVYLIDYRLGAFNGIDLIRQASAEGFQGPFILLTGQEEREIDLQAMRAGAMDYLVKGEFDSSLLERSIRYALEQVRVLKALGQSEARYRKLVEQLPAVTYVCSPTHRGKIAYISPQILTLSGEKPESYLESETLFEERIHPEDRASVMAALQGMGTEKNQFHLEYRLLSRSGETVFVRDEGVLVSDDRGKPLFFQGIITDMSDRKQKEADLLVKNNAVETSIAGIIFTDLAGNITYANSSFLKMWGYGSLEEILEIPVVYLCRETSVFSSILEVLYDQSHWIGEKTAHKKRGEAFEVQILANMLKDKKDLPVCLMFSFLDITERKKAEETVRRLSRAVEQSQSTIMMTDVQGRITYVNPIFETITGYSREEALGKNPRFVKSGYHSKEEYQRLWKMITTGKTWHGELKNRRKDGSYYWEDSIISPIFGEDGKILNFVAVKQDITLRKEVEEALKTSEERYRLLFNSGNDAVFVNLLNPEGTPGRFIEINELACRELEYERQDLLLKDFADILNNPEDLFLTRFHEKTRTSDYLIFETILLSRQGKTIPVEINAHAFELNGQRALLSIARDISERIRAKQQEQLLIQQSKLAAMGEMIGAIAHQWRQPLNGLSILIQDLEDAYEYGEMSREYLQKAVQGALFQIHFMSRTIDDFRNFFKPSKSREPFSIIRAIRETLFLIAAQLKNQDIRVDLECLSSDCTRFSETSLTEKDSLNIQICPNCPILVEGYLNEFRQVILNLLENSREAILESRKNGKLGSQETGRIKLALRKNTHQIKVEVTDNGGGIPETVLPRIFEPYFTTRAEGKGTGIGLYMSKVIIENNMGGRLWAQNGKEGAVFSLILKSISGEQSK